MNPKAIVDRAQNLRRNIISELLQHPLTLFPFGTVVMSSLWMICFGIDLAPALLAIGGVTVGACGAAYNLLYNVERIQQRILAKWKAEDKEREEARLKYIDQALEMQTQEVRKLWDNLNQYYPKAVVSAKNFSSQALLSQLEDNHDIAIDLFERLCEMRFDLFEHRLYGIKNAEGKDSKVLGLERKRIIQHLTQLVDNYNKLTNEIIDEGGHNELDEASRRLRQLESTTQSARELQAEFPA